MSQPTPTNAIEEVHISADSHMAEPFDLWETRLPPALRDQALRFPGLQVGAGHHTRAGGWDPKERLKDMAHDGISAEVLYPSLGMGAYRTRDPKLAAAYARTYNDWLIDFCGEAPYRLWGQAILPLWDIDWATSELNRCRKAGLVGATIWLVPPDELPFYSSHYERFWAACQESQTPVSMHINAGPPTVDGAPISERATSRRQSRPAEPGPTSPPIRPHRNLVAAMNALSDIIGSGVLERYPRLRVGVAEVGVGWIPYWLKEEFDRRYIQGVGPRLKALPSDYFYRQGFATFLDDTIGGQLLPYWGADSFMWSNDYPHEKCIWPESDATIARILGDLSPDARSKAVCRTVASLYRMPIPARPPRPAEAIEGLLPSIRWTPTPALAATHFS
ncbi:MAG TPA: amidohydrolase family protein [Chloroflexota bacterium]